MNRLKNYRDQGSVWSSFWLHLAINHAICVTGCVLEKEETVARGRLRRAEQTE
jgi:hypothetical protein